jgi:Na+/melibiose symporter-like transporter
MNKLNKRREPIFALAAFGPNFLNLFFAVYIQNALLGKSDNGFDPSNPSKVIVSIVLFSILFTISKIVDALLNIPMAHLSDRTKSRWGRRRPCILLGMVGLILAYLALCNPISMAENSVNNTLYIFFILGAYFASYCLCLESFYASFPEITYNVQARIRLTN